MVDSVGTTWILHLFILNTGSDLTWQHCSVYALKTLALQAEKLFVEVLKRLLAGGEEEQLRKESNAVVEISLKLASIYQARGELDKAHQGFEFCTKTQERKIQKQGEAWRFLLFLVLVGRYRIFESLGFLEPRHIFFFPGRRTE